MSISSLLKIPSRRTDQCRRRQSEKQIMYRRFFVRRRRGSVLRMLYISFIILQRFYLRLGQLDNFATVGQLKFIFLCTSVPFWPRTWP